MFTVALMGTDVDIVTHWGRMSSTDGVQRQDIANLITLLKNNLLWDKIGILCVVHDNAADSLLNLKGSSSGAPDSTAVNSPTFTADEGYLSSDADSKYISLGISESSADVYAQYSAHAFFYLRTFNETSIVNFPMVVGINANGRTGMTFSNDAVDFMAFEPHQGVNSSSIKITQNTPIGFAGMSATDNTNRHARLNDTVGSESVADTHTMSTDTMVVGSGVDEQFAAWGIGSELTAAELATYENIIRAYMQARGADVY